jgi:hypothetical protein
VNARRAREMIELENEVWDDPVDVLYRRLVSHPRKVNSSQVKLLITNNAFCIELRATAHLKKQELFMILV